MRSFLDSLFKHKVPFIYTDQRYQVKKLLKEQFARSKTIVLFYLDIKNMSEIEAKFGFQEAGHILIQLERVLLDASHSVLRGEAALIAIQKLWGDDYAVYLSWEGTYKDEIMKELCLDLKREVEDKVNKRVTYPNINPIEVHIGYAKIDGDDLVKEMYTSVKYASQMAKFGIMSREFKNIELFNHILETEDIHMVAQPIVSLKTGALLGWESLLRGPEGSAFYSPADLFDCAQKTGRSFQLESLCRRKAIDNFKYIESSCKLFINLDARSIDDPFLLRGEIFKQMERYRLTPHNIVFEITERHAIKNFDSFREIIQEYRKKGYLIAVDDAGAGYSSLEAIAEIYPDYIKLDMALIRNVDIDPIKQALLETFVKFANKVKCKIIAEGIETESELETLINLGVDYGQGFILGRPNKEFLSIREEAGKFIKHLNWNNKTTDEEYTNKVGDILTSTICVTKDTLVREVHYIFERNNKIDSLVIVNDKQPIGLIMRSQIYQILGGQYGSSLYYEKSISQIMNKSPLIVDKRTKIDEVAKLAMDRVSFHLYDVIIVTENDKYLGIVSVQSLLDMLAKVQLEMAAVSNPLTGLPGNIRIEKEISKRLNNKQDFSVIYCDLDKFKFFNDQYGFEIGDEIILRTAKILATANRVIGDKQGFVGHIGGDDFIIITDPAYARQYGDYIKEHFYSQFKGGEGLRVESINQDTLCISLACLNCLPGRYNTPLQVSEMAAKVKKAAKQINGLSFVEDEYLLQKV
ncbi:GGDEF domain-containing protein [Aneurinibacillus sp. Ricciae_BoGa-3]|uniref:GGDEF domain-containing protein n=1 Tax=Aneurinibacillus sp. Ricciae_BoGa-3 TaxID=3022697 RepID=UPI00234288FF|nr:GGDEF domain-containing protein [Aneurinibacillus sp. Ricciae_BoGa-3]WCK54550.1 GGDEF domain-containing protein [Aneurinibacillus sp. Ricciae_BoGa-3]